MSSNDRAGIAVPQPRDKAERSRVAVTCCSSLGITMPMVVDEMNDLVGHLYSGMPDRLYVIDRDGRVAYKGGRGPFGFNVREMEQSLILTLLDQETKPAAEGRVPLLEGRDAWARLPAVEKGGGQPLPSWALALAEALPRTTAAMLELDYAQRARSPLDPKLRAKMRWVAARANRCPYSQAYAAADLRRAGGSDADLTALAGDRSALPAAEQKALDFARRMTLSADAVTDDEVAELKKLYGEKQLVAMVLLLAYANFQDRLVLALGLPVEPGGPLPPVEVRFRTDGKAPTPAERKAVAKVTGAIGRQPAEDPDWARLDFGALQQELDQQRARPPRIRVPSWEEVRQLLPPDRQGDKPWRIRWSLVCGGYQPELAFPWFRCLRAFAEDARQDRVFEESLFWVITRSIHCFY
jgi:alkylhydroperoxidase family enzyme